MKIIRVFPSKTRATPDDNLTRLGPPDLLDEADEVHISVTFSWDKRRAEDLAEDWRHVAPVILGGPAYETPGDLYPDAFVPGRYLRDGYVITSRGCIRRCWFCGVWQRRPTPIPVPIVDGWNVLDDNLLACPPDHVERVFTMLRRQKRRVSFSGGLEALSLTDRHVELLAGLRPRPAVHFAFDPGDEIDPLASAARRLKDAGFTEESHRMRCYVLVGYPGDSIEAAQGRLSAVLRIGFTPTAMLWRPARDESRHAPAEDWRRFARTWIRPEIIHARRAAWPSYPPPTSPPSGGWRSRGTPPASSPKRWGAG